MLRPATPLTVLLFVAFVLLLLSVISTPVVKGIPLATFEGVDFGVFGYCKGSSCSGVRIGYTTQGLFGNPNDDGDFNLPSAARHSLSSLLVIHPIAALLTLICFGLAAASHLHSPSHSPRYLLGLLILLIPTLLLSLLAFLVDVLLFVPHLQWAGWVVLAGTIVITASMVLTCAMRRTLVSRKARKKRIAENAEMSGENFYNRQSIKEDSPPPMTMESKAPMVNGAPGANSLPSFATFDPTRKETGVSEEDRIPLNSRDPSTVRGPNSIRDDGSERYGGGSQRRGYNGPRDEFGNPLPPSAAFGAPPGPRRDPSDPRLRNQYSNGSVGSQGRGPPGYGGRGRGGHPPRGRGGFGPRGPPPPGGFNGRGPPMGPGAVGGMAVGAMAMRGRGRGPPPGYPPQQGDYNRDMPGPYGPPGSFRPRPPQPGQGSYGYGGPEPMLGPPGMRAPPDAPPMPSMPPAAGMDGRGQMAGYGPGNRFPEGDDDVQGMVGLQQNRMDPPLRQNSGSSPVTPYGPQDSYVPARAGWDQRGPPIDHSQPQGPVHVSPVELPTSSHSSPNHRRVSSGDHYYEDVDPRFAESDPSVLPSSSILPAALTPGGGMPHAQVPPQGGNGAYLQPSNSDDDIQEGARSPAASETSHFTSVSQRGVNPNWGPPSGMPMRKPVGRERDMILGNNPDFEIPGAPRGGRSGGGRGGRMPGQIPPGLGGLGGQGRYPTGNM